MFLLGKIPEWTGQKSFYCNWKFERQTTPEGMACSALHLLLSLVFLIQECCSNSLWSLSGTDVLSLNLPLFMQHVKVRGLLQSLIHLRIHSTINPADCEVHPSEVCHVLSRWNSQLFKCALVCDLINLSVSDFVFVTFWNRRRILLPGQ